MVGHTTGISLLIALVTLIGSVTAFYLPGVAPADYPEHQAIDVKVLTYALHHYHYYYTLRRNQPLSSCMDGWLPSSVHMLCCFGGQVNKLDSVKTQLPYDYYSLPFCQPNEIVEVGENLGEILAGDMIETSPYQAAMKDVCS
jgi:hypothetical protein